MPFTAATPKKSYARMLHFQTTNLLK